MEWYKAIPLITFGVIMLILMITSTIKDIKIARNQAPGGKTFIKKFSKALSIILELQEIYKNENQYIDYVPANINNTLFKVKVEYKMRHQPDWSI